MLKLIVFLFLIYPFAVQSGEAYSVISHIAIIDSSWKDSIVPAIQHHFPKATEEEIRQARKYAYGGCIIQDLGFYPRGNKFFSDLLHYVRSGTFIKSLLINSSTPSDYAFALGALAHYSSDNTGHAMATNKAVPILYPDLRKKYGDEVTFDEKPSAHLKVEFGYDVVQVARGNYLSDDYHDFIGFDVSRSLLEKCVKEVYGLPIDAFFSDFEATIGTYRYTVTGLIPDAIKVAWQMKKDDIEKLTSREKFFFRMPRSEFETAYGKNYKKPSIFSKILAFCGKILPGFGPLKVLKFRTPTPEVETLFYTSFETTLSNYRGLLNSIRKDNFDFPEKDLDTGRITRPGEYRRTDRTYAKWLEELSRRNFSSVDEPMRNDLLSFYRDPAKLLEPAPGKRKKLQEQLEVIRNARGPDSQDVAREGRPPQ